MSNISNTAGCDWAHTWGQSYQTTFTPELPLQAVSHLTVPYLCSTPFITAQITSLGLVLPSPPVFFPLFFCTFSNACRWTRVTILTWSISHTLSEHTEWTHSEWTHAEYGGRTATCQALKDCTADLEPFTLFEELQSCLVLASGLLFLRKKINLAQWDRCR